MKMHIALSGEPRACMATERACPRDEHFESMRNAHVFLAERDRRRVLERESGLFEERQKVVNDQIEMGVVMMSELSDEFMKKFEEEFRHLDEDDQTEMFDVVCAEIGLRYEDFSDDEQMEIDKSIGVVTQDTRMIESLSYSGSTDVREAVSLNSHTPVDVLTRMGSDRDGDVRLGVARHSKTPVDVLLTLSQDWDNDVAEAAQANFAEAALRDWS